MLIPHILPIETWPPDQNKTSLQNNSATLFSLAQDRRKGSTIGMTSITGFRKRDRFGFDL